MTYSHTTKAKEVVEKIKDLQVKTHLISHITECLLITTAEITLYHHLLFASSFHLLNLVPPFILIKNLHLKLN